MLGGEGGGIAIGLLLRLLDQAGAFLLSGPGADPRGQRVVLRGGKNSDLALALRLAFVLLDCCIARRQFRLNARAFVSRCPVEILLSIGEFVGVEPELSLG